MKNITRNIISLRRSAGLCAILCCAGLLNGASLFAGESASAGKAVVEPAQEDENFQNWVNLSLGGLILGGDQAQFKQQEHNSSIVNGGIDDMHYEKTFGKKTQLTIDGHAIFDNSDYKVKIELSQQDLGYIRAGYTQFRTWSDSNGGYLPSVSPLYPHGQFFAAGDNELGLDHGDIWVELGLRVPNLPELTVRYDHTYRYGQEASTEWGTGYLNPPRVPIGANLPTLSQKKVMPTYQDINETRDIITFDATKTLFGNTDLGLGMRYEYNKNNDSQYENNLGNRGAANQTWLTQNNVLDLNLYNGHFSTVTRFSDSFWLTTAYSYSSINSDTAGTRLTGTVGGPSNQNTSTFNPLHPLAGWADLNGQAVTDQQVINFNLMWVPVKDLTITPAVRIGVENTDANSPYMVTGTSHLVTGTNFLAASSNHFNEVEESLDIRYTGIDNILLYLRGNWDERTGDFQQTQTVGLNSNGAPILHKTGSNSIGQDANNTYLSQKYAVGANWYPLMGLNFAVQYYYQNEQNDYNWTVPGNVNVVAGKAVPKAGTNLGVINAEELITNDVNARMTWHPFSTLALVSRYDMQYMTFDNSGIGGSTAGGTALVPSVSVGDIQSAKITNNMFTESITWNPLARLYFQGNASFVLSETDTPAGSRNLTGNGPTYNSPTVLNFKNNYYELGCDVGFILDDKTDLHASYNFYRAYDYQNNISVGMPYGAGAIQNTITAGIVRKLTKNISLSLNYSYVSYSDQTSGYNNNYTANMIYSGLQFRF